MIKSLADVPIHKRWPGRFGIKAAFYNPIKDKDITFNALTVETVLREEVYQCLVPLLTHEAIEVKIDSVTRRLLATLRDHLEERNKNHKAPT